MGEIEMTPGGWVPGAIHTLTSTRFGLRVAVVGLSLSLTSDCCSNLYSIMPPMVQCEFRFHISIKIFSTVKKNEIGLSLET